MTGALNHEGRDSRHLGALEAFSKGKKNNFPSKEKKIINSDKFHTSSYIRGKQAQPSFTR